MPVSTWLSIKTLDGTWRASPPDETLATLRSVQRKIGISRVANVTGMDSVGLPVWSAIRPSAKSLATSQGKGTSDKLAYISAVMECVEQHCMESTIPVTHRASVFDAQQSDEYISPFDLPLRRSGCLDARKTLDWAKAKDWETRATRLVPTQLFRMDDFHRDLSNDVFIRSSSGIAAGN